MVVHPMWLQLSIFTKGCARSEWYILKAFTDPHFMYHFNLILWICVGVLGYLYAFYS